MDSFILFIGLVAAGTTSASFFPQVVKVMKTKSTKDISLGMFSLMTFGVLCWLIYGILRKDPAVIAANVVTIVLSGIILFYKIRYS
ncbi:MAG TPA: hypothetical protein DCY48_00990 [Candidatus Magasanikbacteria bacterium]|nr:MAG: hypothetical protein A3I74_01920 [Candidatus Magasanikbacteria bacterium RIFCSPLOWO2_02_FULL_47_16]OGH79821.1 MAG: hypothetical protein A3C10_05170 [Candidatus Magasanikbacteria bacterium RIFCSPHIGHO2_02_FULL_48_18]OGH83043.1 MAG: hypothetical protein A3G08_01345 [Candidatus Magasanikbacteria bacterium RIFCSPLOWO2_12_FULL_47_9b]HAZ28336.1 hypothetical protein [Candidatus Magasanikbacteria bacterium]